MKTTGKYFRTATWIFILIAIPCILFAQEKIDESLRWEYDISGNTKISIENKIGELEVKTWNKNKVLLEGHILIKGKEKEVEKIMTAIKEMKVSQSNSELKINTLFYKSWTNNVLAGFKKIKIKLGNGTNVTLSEFSVSYTLTIPEGNEFHLKQKYEDVTIPNLRGNTILDIYDCDFRVGKLLNKAKINLKYSKGNIISTRDVNLDIYDSKLELEETGNLTLISKYSVATFQKTANINIDSYDDKINIVNHGDIVGKGKYTALIINNMDRSNLELFDCTFKAGKINTLVLTAKYCKIDITSVRDLNFTESYDNQVSISYLGNLVCPASKYTNFKIESLANEFKMTSYDDNITISNVNEGFSGIEMDWKYTTLVLENFESDAYNVDFDAKYTKLVFPKEKIKEISFHKDGSDFKYKGIIIGADAKTSPTIKIKGYDGRLEIK